MRTEKGSDIPVYAHTKAFLHKVGHGVEQSWEQIDEEASRKPHLLPCLPVFRKPRRMLGHVVFCHVVC